MRRRSYHPRPHNTPTAAPLAPWAPWRGAGPRPEGMRHACHGSVKPHPWDYAVTVVIPVLDTVELLETAIDLWRNQSLPAFLQVIDTGSLPENWERIAALQAPDLELISLRLNGVRHPSDLVAMAMDAAFSACRTRRLFATHADVFPRRRDFLADVLDLGRDHPVVGYRLSPRPHPGWERMVGHTATLFDMNVMRRLRVQWSLESWYLKNGHEPYDPEHTLPNAPDTEYLMNEILAEAGIEPRFIGMEENEEPTIDANLRHVRSITSLRTYGAAGDGRRALRETWWAEARDEARGNAAQWSGRVTVLRILSLPYSGSSLCAAVLDTLHGARAIGEGDQAWVPFRGGWPCVRCGGPVAECELFGAIRRGERPAGELYQAVREYYDKRGERVRLIIDSSKDPRRFPADAEGVEYRTLLLYKEPHEWLYSLRRHARAKGKEVDLARELETWGALHLRLSADCGLRNAELVELERERPHWDRARPGRPEVKFGAEFQEETWPAEFRRRSGAEAQRPTRERGARDGRGPTGKGAPAPIALGYSLLARDPAAFVERVSDWLHWPRAPRRPLRQWWKTDSHLLGGNPAVIAQVSGKADWAFGAEGETAETYLEGKYRERGGGIGYDDAWERDAAFCAEMERLYENAGPMVREAMSVLGLRA